MSAILLVDDHPAICFALKVLLEKNASFVVASSSGDNLIGQLHRDPPDLLILDLELSHADGLDLMPRIKSRFPALKVLIFTNHPAHLYATRCLQAGADGFINKGLPLETIEPLCHLLLAGYQCFPDGVLRRPPPGEEADAAALLARFSDREIAVLHDLKQGKTNKAIAERLALSNKTISTYKTRMMNKCGFTQLSQLLALLDKASDA